jgi:adenylyltransferase/sulfurtransferase
MEGIGFAGQEKIKAARILVIGAGGKGTSAMKALMASGVGFLGICDDNLVQENTLSRQSLFNDNDIGKQKAIVAKQYLQDRNRLTHIKVHNIRLTDENLNSVIKDYDLIIDATNTFSSHFAICKSTIHNRIPLIFSHTENNKIYLTKVKNADEPSIRDIFPNTPEINSNDADTSTPLVMVNSLAGITLANEAIMSILGNPSQLTNNLLIIKLADYSFTFQPK